MALAQDRAPVRYGVVAEGSEVRYRVREQLVGLSFPNDAVGADQRRRGRRHLRRPGAPRPGRLPVHGRPAHAPERRGAPRQLPPAQHARDGPLPDGDVRAHRGAAPAGPAPAERHGALRAGGRPHREGRHAAGHVGRHRRFDGPTVTIRARTAFRFGDFGLRVPRVSVVLERGGRHQARGRSRPAPGRVRWAALDPIPEPWRRRRPDTRRHDGQADAPGQRRGPGRRGRRSRDAPPLRPPERPRADRDEVRLRARAVRRLHRPPRRPGRPLVLDARQRRRRPARSRRSRGSARPSGRTRSRPPSSRSRRPSAATARRASS